MTTEPTEDIAAEPTASKTVTPSKSIIQAGGKIHGIVPQDFDQAYRIAKVSVMAGARPLSTPYNKPDPTADEQIAAATMVIMAGLELGLPPTQALEVIAMINGRRCIWGDGIPALLWSKGFKLRERIEGEADERVAYCSVIRPDGEEIERKFSVKQAKKARLWDTRETVKRKYGNEWKDVPNDSPWFKYDERMLQMRARGWASRDGASDVLRGLRIAEEEHDQARTMKDITPPLLDDAGGDVINTEQIETITNLIAETSSDSEKLLAIVSAPSINEMTVANYTKAVGLLNEKKRTAAQKESNQ
jgi:hypothetical protein